jgi:opacity protein-like surface antigen
MSQERRARVVGLSAVAAAGLWFAAIPVASAQPLPQPASGAIWTGFHVGAHAGGIMSQETRNGVTPLAEIKRQSGLGWLAGLHVGYDRQIAANALVGMEASMSGIVLSTNSRSLIHAPSFYLSRANWLATLTGRLGWAEGPWLVYVRGGYAATHVKFTGLETAANDSVHVGGVRHGWTIGGGIEYQVSQRVGVGIEYGHFDFGTQHYLATTALGSPLNSRVRYSLDRVTLRLNYRFPD